MRITADEKAATRKRILEAAKSLFRSKGFEQATTRDIAREAHIATGTMFNYFSSKEAVVIELASQGFVKAQRDFVKNRRSGAEIEEDLFALVGAQLRCLRPIRKFVRPLLDSSLSPATISQANEENRSLRADLTEQFSTVLTDHGIEEPSSVALNLFWTLYTGVLAFWTSDNSPKQEDTLSLLDQSMRMFVSWIETSHQDIQ